MLVILKSRKETHFAKGEYNGKTITVLSGSKINIVDSFSSIPKDVNEMRKSKDFVNKDGIVLKDIEFSSPTSAAIFVTGRSVNGYIAWRPDDKMSLKEYFKNSDNKI